MQGTINGYGERCGNANLISIIPNLQLKLGYECLTDEQLASLTPTANYIAELLNFTPDPDAPYVGRNAFAHKGGHARRRRRPPTRRRSSTSSPRSSATAASC